MLSSSEQYATEFPKSKYNHNYCNQLSKDKMSNTAKLHGIDPGLEVTFIVTRYSCILIDINGLMFKLIIAEKSQCDQLDTDDFL
ncbi:Hypothetical predicted protein [Octopus vulgaris]|uniref:Uncharacterized protein n=1 Tax=Octopus vulgaris TaxID=6645 RepID=A0AA36AR69_OCTVU|nr:Hypothetical predicted protein [Octopus vulgaris]